MLLPFPHGHAEVCARDLASDCRALSKKALTLRDAIEKNEANKREREEYDLLVKQIQSLCDVVCLDVGTQEQYRVGDYVTTRRQMLTRAKKASLHTAYEKLRKWLH